MDITAFGPVKKTEYLFGEYLQKRLSEAVVGYALHSEDSPQKGIYRIMYSMYCSLVDDYGNKWTHIKKALHELEFFVTMDGNDAIQALNNLNELVDILLQGGSKNE